MCDMFRVCVSLKGREWAGPKEMLYFSITAASPRAIIQNIAKVIGVDAANITSRRDCFTLTVTSSLKLKVSIKRCGSRQDILNNIKSWLVASSQRLYGEALASRFPDVEMGQPGNDLYWADREEWDRQCSSQTRIYHNNSQLRKKKLAAFESSAAGKALKKRFPWN